MRRSTCSPHPRSMPELPPLGICHRPQQVLKNMHHPTGHGTPCPGVGKLEVEPSLLILTWGSSAPKMGRDLAQEHAVDLAIVTAHEPRGHWF